MTFIPASKILKLSDNLAINGGMEVWQRNTTINNPSNGVFLADKWQVSANGNPQNGTWTVTRETGTDANIDKTTGAVSMKIVVSNIGTASEFRIRQDIASSSFNTDILKRVQNRTVTMTARVRSNASPVGEGARIGLFDGSVLDTSPQHTGNDQFQTLTISKGFGNGVTTFAAFIYAPFAASTTYFDSIMIVINDTPVPYVPLSPEQDLIRAQRYYEKGVVVGQGVDSGPRLGSVSATSGGALSTTYGEGGITVPFKVQKDVTPTISLSNMTGRKYGANNSGDLTVTDITTTEFQVNQGSDNTQERGWSIKTNWEAIA